ncbi:MAG: hypothetical protein AB4352_27580 [Hormoscilla sp.]
MISSTGTASAGVTLMIQRIRRYIRAASKYAIADLVQRGGNKAPAG